MSKPEITEKNITFFKENGYLVVENLIDSETIASYQKIYDDFIAGTISVGEEL